MQGIRIRVGTHQLQMARLFGEARSNLSIVTTICIKSRASIQVLNPIGRISIVSGVGMGVITMFGIMPFLKREILRQEVVER